MSWKQKGISICKQAMTGQVFPNFNLKQSLSFWKKSGTKARQQSSNCQEPEYKSLLDEAPVPEGSWAENAKRKDEQQNRVLAAGALTFIITMLVVQKKGLVLGRPDLN